MLKPAQLYKEKLQEQFYKAWYDPRNIFYSGWHGMDVPDLPNNNYDTHHFVSVDKDDNVVGYISYSVNWVAMSASQFGIISFDKGELVLAKDLFQAICNLFEVYHMNKIMWCAYADNPAVKSYRRFIKKYGGRECAYYRQQARLQDGILHDSVSFEILASEFIPLRCGYER